MVLAVTLGSEGHATAEAADERSLLLVYTHVNAQIMLLTEGFPAARVLALVRLRACVKVHVRQHPVVPAGEHL